MTFPDQKTASYWLGRFKSDPVGMANLRSIVLAQSVGSSLARSADGQILEEVAWLLSKGILHLHRVPAPATACPAYSQSSAADTVSVLPRPTPSQTSALSPAPKPVVEADTFSARLDGAATAAVLRSAAADGTPFCEECANAAAARKAA